MNLSVSNFLLGATSLENLTNFALTEGFLPQSLHEKFSNSYLNVTIIQSHLCEIHTSFSKKQSLTLATAKARKLPEHAKIINQYILFFRIIIAKLNN